MTAARSRALLVGLIVAVLSVAVAAPLLMRKEPTDSANPTPDVVHPVAVRAFKAAWGFYPPVRIREDGQRIVTRDLLPVGAQGPLLSLGDKLILVSTGTFGATDRHQVGSVAIHYFEADDLTRPVARHLGAGGFMGQAPKDMRLDRTGPFPALIYTTAWSHDGCAADFVNVVQLRPQGPVADVYYAGGSLTRWTEAAPKPVRAWALESRLTWTKDGFDIAYAGADQRVIRHVLSDTGARTLDKAGGLPMCYG